MIRLIRSYVLFTRIIWRALTGQMNLYRITYRWWRQVKKPGLPGFEKAWSQPVDYWDRLLARAIELEESTVEAG